MPVLDPLEMVEHLAVPDGDGWRAIYFDSPASLTPKLALADDARAGRRRASGRSATSEGWPTTRELIATFRAGELSTAARSGEPVATSR